MFSRHWADLATIDLNGYRLKRFKQSPKVLPKKVKFSAEENRNIKSADENSSIKCPRASESSDSTTDSSVFGNTSGSPPESPHIRVSPKPLNPARNAATYSAKLLEARRVYERDAQPYKLLLLQASDRLLVAMRKWKAVIAFDLSPLRHNRIHPSASSDRLCDAATGAAPEQVQSASAHLQVPEAPNETSDSSDRRAKEAQVLASGTLALEEVLISGWAARPNRPETACANLKSAAERASGTRRAPERPAFLDIEATSTRSPSPSRQNGKRAVLKKSPPETRSAREFVYLYDLISKTLCLYEFVG